jgi:uncharacterized repeat protein (TIGR01451 family)
MLGGRRALLRLALLACFAIDFRVLADPIILLSKLAVPAIVSAGDVATFEITVRNVGTSTATAVGVSDSLPSAFAWTTGTTGCAVNPSDSSLICGYASLAVGATIHISVSAPTTSSLCGTYENTAGATASNAGPATSNTVTLEVGCPKFNTQIRADVLRGVPGDALGFRFAVRNTGHGIARGATLSDQLPASTPWSVSPPVAGCAVDGNGELTCSFGDIPASAGVALHVKASEPSPCGQFVTGTPSVKASNDPAAGNTSANNVEHLYPSGDEDESCRIDVADVFYLINFLFAGGPAPL